jgi:hypothetical protein
MLIIIALYYYYCYNHHRHKLLYAGIYNYAPETSRISILKPEQLSRTQTVSLVSVQHVGHYNGSWLRHCAKSRKVAGSISDDDIGIFIDIILRLHYGPGVDSASNRNEYQEYCLVKAAGA